MTDTPTIASPSVAAIVLYFRYGDGLFETLSALLGQTFPPEAILVVDNASRDGIVEEARLRFQDVTVAALPENRGYGAGMNFGLTRIPKSDAVLLLSHDCVLASSALERMVGELETTSDAGVVGPLLGFRTQRDLVFSAGGFFDPRGRSYHHGWREPLEAWRDRGPADVGWLDGACQLVRRQTLMEVGPLDTDYFVYWEEVAYHARVWAKGWRVRCARDAIAWQEPGGYCLYYQARNRLRYLWRHRSLRTFGTELARALYDALVIADQRKTRVIAIWDFVRGYSGPSR